MPRTIFINRLYYPDHSATSQLLTELAECLTVEGRQVHVITGRQLYEDANAGLAGRSPHHAARRLKDGWAAALLTAAGMYVWQFTGGLLAPAARENISIIERHSLLYCFALCISILGKC